MIDGKSRIDTNGKIAAGHEITYLYENNSSPLIVQLDACLDMLVVLLPDRLQLDVHSCAPSAMSVSRWLTQPCPYGLASSSSSFGRHLHSDIGAVKKDFDVASSAVAISLALTVTYVVAFAPSFGAKILRACFTAKARQSSVTWTCYQSGKIQHEVWTAFHVDPPAGLGLC
ncbi:hypothetical protein Acr_20g0006270 [Actinidia rufa]|uniref:Uncharacterized protein n=1 Tax=Actinidia rufa TaxID=165716 RepID=A0A7J0GDI2_9ERIC|nr:hypothetical protein Acr_20g0006270 [Actinidia rufa]